MENENKSQKRKKHSFIKGVKRVGRAALYGIPLAIGALSTTLGAASIIDHIDASQNVRQLEDDYDYSVLAHVYNNDEIATKIVNNTLEGKYGIEAQTYVDSLISNRAAKELEDKRKVRDDLYILVALLGMVSSVGLSYLITDINQYAKEEEERQERERIKQEEMGL